MNKIFFCFLSFLTVFAFGYATIFYDDEGRPNYERINESMEKQFDFDWISVDEMMPPVGEPVLLYQSYPNDTAFNCRADPLKRTFIRLGGLRYDGKFVLDDDQHSEIGVQHVSHWMMLPNPPKKYIKELNL